MRSPRLLTWFFLAFSLCGIALAESLSLEQRAVVEQAIDDRLGEIEVPYYEPSFACERETCTFEFSERRRFPPGYEVEGAAALAFTPSAANELLLKGVRPVRIRVTGVGPKPDYPYFRDHRVSCQFPTFPAFASLVREYRFTFEPDVAHYAVADPLYEDLLRCINGVSAAVAQLPKP